MYSSYVERQEQKQGNHAGFPRGPPTADRMGVVVLVDVVWPFLKLLCFLVCRVMASKKWRHGYFMPCGGEPSLPCTVGSTMQGRATVGVHPATAPGCAVSALNFICSLHRMNNSFWLDSVLYYHSTFRLCSCFASTSTTPGASGSVHSTAQNKMATGVPHLGV